MVLKIKKSVSRDFFFVKLFKHVPEWKAAAVAAAAAATVDPGDRLNMRKKHDILFLKTHGYREKGKKKHASPDRQREKVDHHKITSMLIAAAAAVAMNRWSVKGVADCIGMVGAKEESRIILLSGVKDDPLFKTRIMR